jgi:hypothetical protein
MSGECRTLVGDGKYIRSFNLKNLKEGDVQVRHV